jgi:hypothetical protein
LGDGKIDAEPTANAMDQERIESIKAGGVAALTA